MIDDEVQSDPVINEPITGGRVRISFGVGLPYGQLQRKAQDLMILLRYGSISSPLELESKTIISADDVETK